MQKQDKGGKKKKSRRGNSLVELRFLRRLNKHGGEGYTAKDLLCTAKSQFRRVVRDYILHHAKSNLRETKFRVHALLALQEAAESYLVTLFEHMNLVAIHAKRKTVLIKDLALIRTMRSMDQTLNPMK